MIRDCLLIVLRGNKWGKGVKFASSLGISSSSAATAIIVAIQRAPRSKLSTRVQFLRSFRSFMVLGRKATSYTSAVSWHGDNRNLRRSRDRMCSHFDVDIAIPVSSYSDVVGICGKSKPLLRI